MRIVNTNIYIIIHTYSYISLCIYSCIICHSYHHQYSRKFHYFRYLGSYSEISPSCAFYGTLYHYICIYIYIYIYINVYITYMYIYTEVYMYICTCRYIANHIHMHLIINIYIWKKAFVPLLQEALPLYICI
jgi:hypothetical protein